MQSQSPPKSGYRVREAFGAVRALMRDPNDVAQVFTVVNALPGASFERIVRRLRTTPEGSRLLAAKPSIARVLCERDKMRALPDGTLGREYARFMDDENISVEGLVAAGQREGRPGDELEFVFERLRDTHDLWHVVTRYKGDLLGEAALQAFNFAQIRHPGIGFIAGAVFVRGHKIPGIRTLVAEGFRRGLRSSWLPAVAWEDLLTLPVDVVAQRLGIPQGRPYAPLRIADLPGGKIPS